MRLLAVPRTFFGNSAKVLRLIWLAMVSVTSACSLLAPTDEDLFGQKDGGTDGGIGGSGGVANSGITAVAGLGGGSGGTAIRTK